MDGKLCLRGGHHDSRCTVLQTVLHSGRTEDSDQALSEAVCGI